MDKMKFIITALMLVGTIVFVIGSLMALTTKVVKHIICRLQIGKPSE